MVKSELGWYRDAMEDFNSALSINSTDKVSWINTLSCVFLDFHSDSTGSEMGPGVGEAPGEPCTPPRAHVEWFPGHERHAARLVGAQFYIILYNFIYILIYFMHVSSFFLGIRPLWSGAAQSRGDLRAFACA